MAIKRRSALAITFGGLLAAIAIALAGAVALGGPATPPALTSINEPFMAVDYRSMPALSQFTARDRTRLSYRSYPPQTGKPLGSVVLVHGSSASSNSMHVLAQAFSAAGYAAFALDIRGHGASGRKGKIAYVGQLEDDMEDFVKATSPPAPATLAGFSAGGGFAMRVAGSARQQLFQNYLFLSPFVSQDAPSYRAGGGNWASVGLPRIIALALLNRVGIDQFNDLPVTRFALNESAKAFLTPEYSFALAINFRPEADYLGQIAAMRQPARLVAGAADEVFVADRFEESFSAAGRPVPVTLVAGVGHVGLILQPAAIAAAINAVNSLRTGRP